jgi:tRNA(Ile)-lysidine synthase
VSTLSEQVGETIQTRKLFRRGQSILVAVSGGVDSMVLLHLLQQLAHINAWRLVVGHFNHQLRGAESDADEQWVQAVAARLDLPFVSERWPVQARRRARGLGLEMAAREARHEFLGRTAVQRKIPTVALAHHADDQVELFFLRLFRGAGGEGLGGMKWLAPSLFHAPVQLARPLLEQPKAALEVLAGEQDIAFREDASNARFDHERNRIRHELLPWLRANYAPAVSRTVLRAMEIIRAEAEWVAAAAKKWRTKPGATGFDRLPLAIQRQCLRQQLQARGIPAGYELVESLRICPNRPVTTEPGHRVVRDQAGRVILRVQRKSPLNTAEMVLSMAANKGVQVFDGVEVSWQLIRKKPAFSAAQSQAGCEYFSDLGLTPAVRLRHWRNGDRFQPIGLGQAVKLQDLFTNLKIPRERRRELLVAETLGGQIFWVEGLRMSEQFKLDKATVRIVKWRWSRRSTGTGGPVGPPV